MAENAPTLAELSEQRALSLAQNNPRRISIVCPVYNTPTEILKQTIQSVEQQTYPHWELCLAVSERESAELWRMLNRLADSDPRIRVVPLKENQGIAESTNAAINASLGDWVAFLDHDDLLAPHALYLVADHLNQHPECDLVYTDEDLLSFNGRICKSPTLKPDWSPEMLLAFNYICHFVVIRRKLIEKAGGLRPEYDGAQDRDLLLRIAEQTVEIHHIPEILYHWRESKSSTAGRLCAKSYVAVAQEAVLQDCLVRRGIEATVSRTRFGHYRMHWCETEDICVSIVIPNRNQPNLIRKAVEGVLYRTRHKNTEIIIVDNQSSDPEVLKLYENWEAKGQIKVVDYGEPFNYSKACNLGAARASGEFLLFLNNDIQVLQYDWLTELLGWAKQPGVGVVGGHLLYPDGRTQHAGIVLGLFELAGHVFSGALPEAVSPFGMAEWLRNVSAATGACQLVKRSLFESLGGYDEEYQIVYSDIEFCLRASAEGYRTVCTPHCRLIHHECSTRRPGNNHADAKRFAQMLLLRGVAKDRYYHQALSAFGRCPQFKSGNSRNVADNLCEQIEKLVESAESGAPISTLELLEAV
jgi:GT2 family glycosyltransferase